MERKESKENKTKEKLFSRGNGLKFFLGRTKTQVNLEGQQRYSVMVEMILSHLTTEITFESQTT